MGRQRTTFFEWKGSYVTRATEALFKSCRKDGVCVGVCVWWGGGQEVRQGLANKKTDEIKRQL